MKINKILLGSIFTLTSVVASCTCVEEQTTTTDSVHKVCSTGEKTKGIDISKYQGNIDWFEVKNSGIEFAFARVSDGANNIDKTFSSNWISMKKAGLIRGSYQYFRPSQDASEQAYLFLNILNQNGGLEPNDFGMVVDIEETEGLKSEDINSALGQWLEVVEKETNRTPIIYTGPSFWDSNKLDSAFSKYPLWVAHYTTSCPLVPDAWKDWSIWQYSGSGSVPGINASTDLNVFNGNKLELEMFINPVVADSGIDVITNDVIIRDSGADEKADYDAIVDANNIEVSIDSAKEILQQSGGCSITSR